MDIINLKCGCVYNSKSPKNDKWTRCSEAQRLLELSRKFWKEYKYRLEYDLHFKK